MFIPGGHMGNAETWFCQRLLEPRDTSAAGTEGNVWTMSDQLIRDKSKMSPTVLKR